jgi:hypothetical protein
MFRPAAVAGQFYPANAESLAQEIDSYLSRVDACEILPKALIAPHAGYVYSGPIAAAAYTCLAPFGEQINRVILLGPSHHVYFKGIALCDADAYVTPFGPVPIATGAQRLIADLPQVLLMSEAHAREHSLEVHLPFLQCVLGGFDLVPLVVGDCSPQDVSEVLDRLWGDKHTVIVVSTDLSHFHDYETARRIDQETSDAIENFNFESIHPEAACGCRPLNGLLYNAITRHMQITKLGLCNSGDTAGSKSRVVGYGAYAVSETE